MNKKLVKEKTETMTRVEKMIVAIQLVNNPKKSTMMGFTESCVRWLNSWRRLSENNDTIVQ